MNEQRTQPHGSLPAARIHRMSVTVTRGPNVGAHLHAEPGAAITIGSAADNDLPLGDQTVSRYHLELVATPEGIAVRDLGSTNGTYLGKTRIRDATVAAPAQLRIGDTTFMVSAETATAEHESHLAIAGLLYRSAPMLRVAKDIRKLASFGGSVLVQGETGTGKELVARALHDEGPRNKGPFVIVDCGALSPNLVESELFGHERGAFTGASDRFVGAFERAHGGTLFLDEVGELPTTAQPALLGVLERKALRRVGGSREVAVDVRVVCATHRDLRAEVNRGSFRADLYYRIAAARIAVPPLRDRREDIPLLAAHFASHVTGAGSELSEDLLARWTERHWSGNVRELRNAVERLLAEGGDEEQEAADGVTPSRAAERYRDARAKTISAFEREFVTSLMEGAGGNASEAARRAQMDRPYLLSLLKKYGLR